MSGPMEWGDLRVFLQVARAGQIAGASRSLELNHSTISRRIARLEERMGVLLFDRAGRRLHLTDAGARLLAAAEKLESLIIRDVLSLGEAKPDITGRVRIGTSEGFGAHYLAPQLPRFTAAYPGLEIELLALPRTYSLGMREADLAITMDRPQSGDIRFKKLSGYALAVYASSRYLDRRGRPDKVEALRDHDWCGYINDLLFTDELDMMSFGDVSITPAFRTTSVTAQLEAVKSGDLMSILPCYMADPEGDLERVLPQEISLERTYWLSVHGDLATSPRVRAVMAEIENWVQRDRQLFLPERRGGV